MSVGPVVCYLVKIIIIVVVKVLEIYVKEDGENVQNTVFGIRINKIGHSRILQNRLPYLLPFQIYVELLVPLSMERCCL